GWSQLGGRLTNLNLQFQFADRDAVTRFQNDFATQVNSIDERPVRASQVTQSDREIINGKDTVVPAYQITIWSQVAVLLTPDKKLLGVQRDQLTLMLSTKDFQFGLQHVSGTPLI